MRSALDRAESRTATARSADSRPQIGSDGVAGVGINRRKESAGAANDRGHWAPDIATDSGSDWCF